MKTITKTIKNLEPTPKEAIEWLKKEYSQGVELVYIDYRDSIENPKQRESILQDPANAWEAISADDWVFDCKMEGEDSIIRQFSESGNGLAYDLSEKTMEAMEEWIRENDTSDPVKDLLKNTSDEYLYYDTGISFEDFTSYNVEEKEIEKRAKIIAKKLKIDYKKHKKDLRELITEAYYGGQLVILFENNINNFLTDTKFIKFSKYAEVCLMDRVHGSGYSVKLEETLLFEFNRENIHTDKGDNGYSFAYDVCGLVSNIMEDGVLTNKGDKRKVIKVGTNEDRKAQRKQEERYIANWKAGKCTFGDMNIKRHKDTSYINEYPCGNKCTACNTFWID